MAFRVVTLCGLVMMVLALVVRIHAKEEVVTEKEFVMTLDHSNFTTIISKYDFIVVQFYAPWCGHCKRLAPEYEKAASALSKHDPPITLAKVDASDQVNKELALQYNIEGFPTIKILRNGGKSSQEYKSPREADGIVDYLKKQLGPASVEIKSIDDAKKHIDEKSIFIVGLFPRFSGEEFENYTRLAENLRSDYSFGHALDAKVLPRGESSVEGPVIRLLKPFDELVVDSQNFQLDAAEKFIEEASVPSLTVYDSDPNNHPYLEKYFNIENNAKAMLLLNFSGDSYAPLRTKYQDIATLFKGKGINFLIGDLQATSGLLQYFGLKEDLAPLIIIHKTDDQKFLKTNLEADQLVPWFKEYMDDKLKPFKKSEPIPEVNDEPVKVVVADSLGDMVLNSQKNVLLEFYARWCGHCKKLAPILEEVAVSYEKDPNVLIAKIDATANDIPSDTFNVMGFPTMYFKSSSGKIAQYEGDRSKEDFINFIQKNRDDITDSYTQTNKKDDVDFSQEPSIKDEL
ncbi:disulfide-isomerase [Ancistrocladus abbreviatus]